MLSKYIVYFYIYSFLGWVYETIVMTLYSNKWDNRGFLFEPILPIYGFGAAGITGILEYARFNGIILSWQQIFVICFLGSIVLEYFTGWLLETLFHAYWWDYSNVIFNIKGRICLPASIGFGIAGLIIAYYVYPSVSAFVDGFSQYTIQFLSYVCVGFVAADTSLTVSALISFEQKMLNMEEVVNSHMESFVDKVHKKLSCSDEKDLSENDKGVINSIVRIFMTDGQQDTIGRIKGYRRNKLSGRFNYVLKLIKRNNRE